jgi:hypothetical protein
MSRYIDLFIDSPAPVEELAATLGTLAGVSFVGSLEGTHWQVRDGEGFAELAEHAFDDDRHLAVSRYRYDLFARVEAGGANETASAGLLRRIFAAVKADGRYPALLVFDLQHLLDQAGGDDGLRADCAG